MDVREELRLVAQVKAGNREALALLWDSITPKLYGYLVNQLRNTDVAEDICQDTWLKAIGSVQKFQDKGVRFSAWVFAIARNECRQYWRNGNREIPVDWTEEGADSGMGTAYHDDVLMVEKAFTYISEEEKEILQLRYISDLSFHEIAAILDISIVAARVRLHRALVRARSFMKK